MAEQDAAEIEARAHALIAYLFDLPVRDMGGGLKIVSLPKQWLDVKDRDLIVKSLSRIAAETANT